MRRVAPGSGCPASKQFEEGRADSLRDQPRRREGKGLRNETVSRFPQLGEEERVLVVKELRRPVPAAYYAETASAAGGFAVFGWAEDLSPPRGRPLVS